MKGSRSLSLITLLHFKMLLRCGGEEGYLMVVLICVSLIISEVIFCSQMIIGPLKFFFCEMFVLFL